MIYIAVALTVEAKPLITYFKLKKDNEIKNIKCLKMKK